MFAYALQTDGSSRTLTASHKIGFLSGAGAFSPLLGQMFGVPMLVIPFLLLPVVALLVYRDGWKTPSRENIIVLGGALFLLFLVAQMASAAQWLFFIDLSQWRFRDQNYETAKLTMVVIHSAPPLLCALALACVKNGREAIQGVMTALIALAFIAVSRIVWSHGGQLFGTSYREASEFFSHRVKLFSIVSYGVLFTLGAIAALRYRYGWLATGLLLFMTALISRRGDTIFLTLAIIGVIGVYSYNERRPAGANALAALALAAALFAIGHNGHNSMYFANLGKGTQYRVEMIEDSIRSSRTQPSGEEAGSVEMVEESSGTGSRPAADASERSSALPETILPEEVFRETEAATEQALPAPTSQHLQTAINLLFGNGLGSFSSIPERGWSYPHNIFLEAFIELGAIGLGLLIAIVAVPFLLAARGISLRKGSKELTHLAAALGIIILSCLKGGDLTFLGRIVFLSVAVVVAANVARHQSETP